MPLVFSTSFICRFGFWTILTITLVVSVVGFHPAMDAIYALNLANRIFSCTGIILGYFFIGLVLVWLSQMAEHHTRKESRATPREQSPA